MKQIVKDIDVVEELEVIYPTTKTLSNYNKHSIGS